MTNELLPLSASEYERYVAELVRLLDFVKHGTVTLNKRFNGVRQPGSYEVDVAVEIKLSKVLKFTLIVECKNWQRPIDRPIIQKLAQTRDAVGADKAAVVSPVGFTREAVEVARALEVALWVITLQEWIVIYPDSTAAFRQELFERDRNRDWSQAPARIDLLEWQNGILLFPKPGDLPAELSWVRFLARPYAWDVRYHFAQLLVRHFFGVGSSGWESVPKRTDGFDRRGDLPLVKVDH